MSLLTAIRSVVGTAFTVVDSLTETFTYSVTEKSYNPSTGALTETTTDYTVKGVFAFEMASQVNTQLVLAKDVKKCILQQSELPITPKMDDYITREDGTVFHVLESLQEPSKSIYILKLRTGS